MKNVNLFHGASQILFGVDLAVERGQTMALLGRNGAGKSTMFKAIVGIAPPRRGEVVLVGAAVSGCKPYRIAPAGIDYVREDRQVFPKHTVNDNLLLGQKAGAGGKNY